MPTYKIFRKVEFRNGCKPLFCFQVEKAEIHVTDHRREMDAWYCHLEYDGRQIKVPFFMGIGHEGKPPNLFVVLDSCFGDAYANDISYSEWCWEFGYEEWNPKHLKTYEACAEGGRQLRFLFGEDYEKIKEEIESRNY